MRATGCFFLFLNVLFGRAFGQLPELGTEFHLWIAGGSLAVWLVVALCGRTIIGKRRLLFAGACIALPLAFAAQAAIVLPGPQNLDAVLLMTLTRASTLAFSLGNVLYLLLWIDALSRFDATDALCMLAIGCVGGIVLTDGLLTLTGGSPGGLVAYGAVRLVALIASLSCLGLLLFGSSRAPAANPPGPHRPSHPNAFSNRFEVIILAAIFALVNFVLNASWARSEETAETGTITLPAAALLIGIVLLSCARLTRDKDRFVPLFCQIAAVGSLVLYLVFVSVTGGLIDYLWVAVHAGNLLIELAILATCTQLSRCEGARAAKAVGCIFAAKETAALLGGVLFAALPYNVLIAINLTLLICALGGWGLMLFRRIEKSGKRSLGEKTAREASLADELAARTGCTAREREVLELLLQGSSYARIARHLVISESTVKTHANHIYAKAGVSNRDELIDLCYDQRA